ncbi:MAG: DEAD/DEAH box helicase [Acholeplasmatales bacterium]|nr:DEAD/DEAH box helicase [Acholeplasmatales bacterium]
MATFESLNLDTEILNALNDLQFLDATEIQERAIPEMSQGKDIIGIAQTGTGKTFAYSIPLISRLTEDKFTQALILCPTRELGIQVSEEIKKLIKYKKWIRIATIYGGASYDKQIKELNAHPQIVIGTPGRIIDHMNRKTVDFSNLKVLVLDEADEMLNMGFKEDLETILATTPQERQTALFSATMPEFIEHVTRHYQQDPVRIEIKKKTLTVDRIKQDLFYLKRESKTDLLIRLLDLYNFHKVMIFVNTKSKVEDIVSTLKKQNYKAEALHGDLKQMSRDKVMKSFKEGISNILVCTDVAARGIDVSDLEAIINFDLPQEQELYVHRIGRTGRAGRDGLSISFASYSETRKVQFIERYTRSKMNICQIPTPEEIKDKINGRFMETLGSHINDEITDSNKKLIDDILMNGFDTKQLLNALLSMTSQTEKEYPEILVRQEKPRMERRTRDRDNRRKNSRDKADFKSRDRRDSKFGKDRSSKEFRDYKKSDKEYVTIAINFGRSDKLRPQELVQFASKICGVRKANIGDIKITENKTYIDVTKGALQFMEKIDGKDINGKIVKVLKNEKK